MRKIVLALLFMIMFFLGWFSAGLVLAMPAINIENPSIQNIHTLFTGNFELSSPNDRVNENKIHVYPDKVVIDVDNPAWSRFADTNSMDPLIDAGANGIEIKPKDAGELKAGDIISFYSGIADSIVVHRIIKTDYDEDGWYAVTKGDNNPSADSGKVRFGNVNGVLIGVVY